MAFWNMAGSGCRTDFLVAWPTAEMSFLDPVIAANVVSGTTKDTPERKHAVIDAMINETSPFGTAGMYDIHDVIDPEKTRDYIIRALEISQGKTGKHKLADWPTKF